MHKTILVLAIVGLMTPAMATSGQGPLPPIDDFYNGQNMSPDHIGPTRSHPMNPLTQMKIAQNLEEQPLTQAETQQQVSTLLEIAENTTEDKNK